MRNRRQLPMFPLGSVLLPSILLPLHVFEQRYRAMIEEVLTSADRSFGVVLIERGHEVGGSDQRSSIGTLARVIDYERSEDGRWGLIAAGVERIKVVDWLPDQPFPLAVIEDWPDLTVATPDHRALYESLQVRHRRLLGLTAELGRNVGRQPDLASDPVLGSYQLAATAPISHFDRQQILSADVVDQRFALLADMLDSALVLAEMELGLPAPGE